MELNVYTHAATVTPSDSADLPNVALAIYVGSTNDVNLVTAGGETLKFVAVPAGTTIPIKTKRVLSTGTTATGIVALWV